MDPKDMRESLDAEYDAIFAQALSIAESLGRSRGKNAASWVIDGNTTTDRMRVIRDGLDDGDPLVLDALPSPWGPEYDEALYEIGYDLGVDLDKIDRESLREIAETYECAWQTAMHDELSRVCAFHLDD